MIKDVMQRSILFAAFLTIAILTMAQSPKKVAVYVSGENEGINKVLESKLVYALSHSERYSAIERTAAFLAEISKEHSYQRTGAVDDNDISRLGKQFGVQYVCVAEVSDAFGEKYISARLIDVETAEVVNSYGVGSAMSSMDDCLKVANEIATNLSKGTFAEQAEEELLRDYVDLGLPSGTLWKRTNESGYYTFHDAVNTFGSQLPSLEQWFELMNYCKWVWSASEYALKASGGNGKFIMFSPLGGRSCSGRLYNVNDSGYYWSSTFRRANDACHFLFSVNAAIQNLDGMMYSSEICTSFPVRLVISDILEQTSEKQSYVDLGLPSGTLWKTYNENKFYDYDSAVSKFGDNLPTRRQWNELGNWCKWEWTGHGYKVTGKNGTFIILPAEGYRDSNGQLGYEDHNGCYWSSASHDSEKASCLGFNSESYNTYITSRSEGLSIRLIQNP